MSALFAEQSRPQPQLRPFQPLPIIAPSPLKRVAFIGNALPRRCGIATFTSDLHQSILRSRPDLEASIFAMTDAGQSYAYSDEVGFSIRDDRIEDYRDAARVLNAGEFDAVSLQHEFGIFGGDAGDHLLSLLEPIRAPIVTTLHTVLAKPNASQQRVMGRLIDLSSRIVVMAEKGRTILREVYGAPANQIAVIPHGIPDWPFAEPDIAKARYGYEGRTVILTFGLLGPSKGVEVMIDAMPQVLKSCPTALYVILGATHPNLVRRDGEAYRESLAERVRALGLENHVQFVDRFVDTPTLLEYISMCDVYATPYLNEAQMTSGALAYSFGLGRAIVSTPYWHAQELLADGRGVIVPFGDAAATGREVAALLSEPARLRELGRRAYAHSRSMTWARTAERYLGIMEEASDRPQPLLRSFAPAKPKPKMLASLPELKIDYLQQMCDDTGLFQHAVYSVPDRAHGYCVDDNARALILACKLNGAGETKLAPEYATRFASFVQHAWNPDNRRFRNFMSFDRRWLEPQGSEDSHGRTLWALGVCAGTDTCPARRNWAEALLAQALPTVDGFTSPRAWAFTLLGLAAAAGDKHRPMQRRLADRLAALLAHVETPDWVWFEDGLSYDNARLPQALILTGAALDDWTLVDAGLRTLAWLAAVQTSPDGLFRPVGTEGFLERRQPPRAFDQQPVEATATIAACLDAREVDGRPIWSIHARQAFAWFHGANDLSAPLVELETGRCRDGLHPDRPNENGGGESVVSYLMAQVDMRRLTRIEAIPTVGATASPAFSA